MNKLNFTVNMKLKHVERWTRIVILFSSDICLNLQSVYRWPKTEDSNSKSNYEGLINFLTCFSPSFHCLIVFRAFISSTCVCLRTCGDIWENNCKINGLLKKQD